MRRLRAAQGLTLAELRRLRIDQSGHVEPHGTGRCVASLDTLAQLAAALNTSCSSLLRDPDRVTSDAQLVRKGEGLEVVRRGTKRGHTYHLLAADRGPRKAFEPFLVTLTDKSELFPEFEHAGQEFIHILEGSLRYRHGAETYLLKPGDTLTFRGDVPHGPDKLLRTPIRMLSIIDYGGNAKE